MNKPKKISLTVFVLLIVLLQFVPVDRTNPPVEEFIDAPLQVAQIFEKSCYDCHSNQTNWPWYSYVAPVSFFITHDVEDGRKHLNFSTWNLYPQTIRSKHINEVIEEISEIKMPPLAYRIIHPNSELSDKEIDIIKIWADKKYK